MELSQFFLEHKDVAVAFSGGVDSAFLLYMAKKYARTVQPYFAVTAFVPNFEVEDARKIATYFDTQLQEVPVDLLSCPSVACNDEARCYHCKVAILGALVKMAKSDGFTTLIEGTNASDDIATRPGFVAVKEAGVLSPLRICGITKKTVRAGLHEAGLWCYDKPSYSCLATRIATGEPLTIDALKKTEHAEAFLSTFGLKDYRVRCRGHNAVLEIREQDKTILFQNWDTIKTTLLKSYDTVKLSDNFRS